MLLYQVIGEVQYPCVAAWTEQTLLAIDGRVVRRWLIIRGEMACDCQMVAVRVGRWQWGWGWWGKERRWWRRGCRGDLLVVRVDADRRLLWTSVPVVVARGVLR